MGKVFRGAIHIHSRKHTLLLPHSSQSTQREGCFTRKGESFFSATPSDSGIASNPIPAASSNESTRSEGQCWLWDLSSFWSRSNNVRNTIYHALKWLALNGTRSNTRFGKLCPGKYRTCRQRPRGFIRVGWRCVESDKLNCNDMAYVVIGVASWSSDICIDFSRIIRWTIEYWWDENNNDFFFNT